MIITLAGLITASFASPASAQTRRTSDGPRVVLTGRVEVRPNERTDSVVIFDGPALINGDVDGAVVAFNGSVRVRGNVDEDVVVLKGRAIIEEGATVGGDVASSQRPRVAPGATVEGDIRRVNFANYFRALGWVLWLVWWLAVSVSVFVLGVLLLALAPRAAASALLMARTRTAGSIGWGLVMTIGLPIVCVVVLFTLVGIPLGLMGLLSLALLFGLGYVVAALALGRRLVREPGSIYLALFVGLIILRLVDLIPVLGNLITALVTIYGVGALSAAAWQAARGRTTPPPASAEARVTSAAASDL
jgi:hypothetical protein